MVGPSLFIHFGFVFKSRKSTLQSTGVAKQCSSAVGRYSKDWCSNGAFWPACHCMTTAAVLAQGLQLNSVPMERAGSVVANITQLLWIQLSAQHSPIPHGTMGSSGSHCLILPLNFSWSSPSSCHPGDILGRMPCSCLPAEDFGMWLVSSGRYPALV